jgi:hypothetical protein
MTEHLGGRLLCPIGSLRGAPSFVTPMLLEPMNDVLNIPDVAVGENPLGGGLFVPQILFPFIELKHLPPTPAARTANGLCDQVGQRVPAQAWFVIAHFSNRFGVPVLHNHFLEARKQVSEAVVDLSPNRGGNGRFAPVGVVQMSIKAQEALIGGRAAHEA